ncbi:phosphate-starvation-inducible PsiE family protein [Spongisporangium articulatum]|uniref:Phosphate-starvation-inducible PsiE family protein n=1 Tax=Spongisporangium articulatum TaxID=3362603 RepID=A0ABW8APL4_9ACTN
MITTKQGDKAARQADGLNETVRTVGERALRYSEDVVYVLIAALLVVGALVLLVSAAGELRAVGEDTTTAVLALLDTLLLVFVLVELIFAVRTTLRRREIVAEPFLVVGIIASIKEIILLSVEAGNILEGKPTSEPGGDLGEFALHIGLLGVLVLVLAGCAVLLRLKEREPEEGSAEESGTDSGQPEKAAT